MDLCIGGPWNGCRLLGENENYSFRIRVNKSYSTTYFRKEIIYNNSVLVFWIADGLSNLQSDEIIENYLKELIFEINQNIE
ncbi:hypothetical protein [uncultured Acinetobacter sp.]|uniref:hypothetical protein n=1 Tax=uncultured Acinetobacter sp. TaxID=165433 RepID=UPI00258CFA63|nr:hypothetical protein [uncultured Acinetobacter sp.]